MGMTDLQIPPFMSAQIEKWLMDAKNLMYLFWPVVAVDMKHVWPENDGQKGAHQAEGDKFQ